MKYMGGKTKLSSELLPIILKDRQENQYYIEPFAGGMNLICNVSGNRIANDVNYYLIAMWKELLTGWIPPKINKAEYYDIKENQQNYPDYLVGWVGFNCSYSGKWFGGFAGETKTKDGSIRDYQDEAIRNVLKQIPMLSGITLNNGSYLDLLIPPNSIVYCDPPYNNTTKYVTDIDYDIFWDWIKKLSKQGHTVFVSEYNAPNDFKCIWQKEVKSSLSANGKSGGSKLSVEKLFQYDILHA